ncbi:S-methyl-5'-thioinosine phosphorylase [uncultured Lamprocystis sp.]|jgi:5'-methylthioadenosine phosphorylase/5'-methylthioinosine phosphorylase|uniref:S-methyl-5'-thioinosine phosphorylase n=1 Tax=uncultured Lamprocystis sp. TaxID=543132 RepID=UPI0025E8E517|nr:S-methyl-5'-thioinosine phosphorylase [uncultured Lamprocystis sp.]
MGLLAIIGGSGFQRLPGLQVVEVKPLDTPFGAISVPLVYGRLAGHWVLFLPRHGEGHRLPPHRINYRANLWALHVGGAQRVLGLAAVGGITARFGPRVFAVPDQVIDYTHGRDQSFHDDDAVAVTHVDFTDPYCPELRMDLLHACAVAGVAAIDDATYGVTQGPRLETAAEITRMERDGCDLVGMTGMPEAALARELGLCYASLAFVVNWAAGKGEGAITMTEIEGHLGFCAERSGPILAALAAGSGAP